jgi:Flp pilus assembly protein TadD
LRQVAGDSTVLLSARLDLSRAEAETGQTSEAIQHLLSVAELDHDGEVYFRLAPLYRKVGDQERAREALDKFKRLRAASLEANKDELGGLENEQAPGVSATPKSP